MFSVLTELRRHISRAEVNRAYKRKAQKVRLVDLGKLDKSKPGRVSDQVAKSKKEDVRSHKGKYLKQLIAKFSNIERGLQLTKEQIEKLIVGGDLILQEHNMFVEMLYNHKKAIAFEQEDKGIVQPEVVLPQVIRTVKHKAQQAAGFLISKVLILVVCKIFQERLRAGTLELCYRPYQNLQFLVEKKNKKY